MKTVCILVILTLVFGANPASSQFSIDVLPKDIVHSAIGGSSIFTLNIQADSGFESTIFLFAQTNNPSVTLKLSKSSLNVPYGFITLNASPVGDTGTAVITVSAVAGTVTKTAECRLHIVKKPQWRVITDSAELSAMGTRLITNAASNIVGLNPGLKPQSTIKMTEFLKSGQSNVVQMPVNKSEFDMSVEDNFKMDKYGGLWSVSNNLGISRWTLNGYTFYNRSNSTLNADYVYNLDFDKSGRPTVLTYDPITNNNFTLQRLQNNVWETIYTSQKKGNSVSYGWPAQCTDSAGNLWFSDVTGKVLRFRGTAIDTFIPDSSILGRVIYSLLFCDRRGNVWCYDDQIGQCWVFDGNNFTRKSLAARIERYAFDGNNALWVVVNNSLICYAGNEATVYNSQNSPLPAYFYPLQHNSDRLSLAIDADNNIWLGIGGNGTIATSFGFAAIFNPDGLKGIPLVLSAEEPVQAIPELPLRISPNPANESFKVEYPDNTAITIRDAFGRVMLRGESGGEFSTEGLAAGVYFVEYLGNNGNHNMQKLVVAR